MGITVEEKAISESQSLNVENGEAGVEIESLVIIHSEAKSTAEATIQEEQQFISEYDSELQAVRNQISQIKSEIKQVLNAAEKDRAEARYHASAAFAMSESRAAMDRRKEAEAKIRAANNTWSVAHQEVLYREKALTDARDRQHTVALAHAKAECKYESSREMLLHAQLAYANTAQKAEELINTCEELQSNVQNSLDNISSQYSEAESSASAAAEARAAVESDVQVYARAQAIANSRV